ncbi:MAG: trigger factor [Cytophagales bacterium]|nr:hypothetical protein [Bernardetiaceae bacterium]MDW8209827.1 trigger factor [Cytophagales bacterium]
MEVSFQKTDALTVLIKVRLKEADYQDRIDKKIKEIARNAHISGFRPGKVPPAIIRNRYGKSIKMEQVISLSEEAMQNCLRENNFSPLLKPLLQDPAEQPDWLHQSDFEFSYEVGLKPEVQLSVGKNITVRKPIFSPPTEEELDKHIQELRYRYASSKEIEEVADSPNVFIKFKVVTVDGMPIYIPTSLASEEKLPFFTENNYLVGVANLYQDLGEHKELFIGKKVGEQITVDIREIFPTDEQIGRFFPLFPKESLPLVRGKFIMTIQAIFERQLPELNEDFFELVFGNSQEIKEESAFREQLRQIKQREIELAQKRAMVEDFKNQLLEAHPFLLPDEFIKRWLKVHANYTPQEVENNYEYFSRDLRLEMILNKLLKDRNIQVEREDLIQVLKEIAVSNLLQERRYGAIQYEELFALSLLNNSEKKQLADYTKYAKLSKLLEACMEEITIVEYVPQFK